MASKHWHLQWEVGFKCIFVILAPFVCLFAYKKFVIKLFWLSNFSAIYTENIVCPCHKISEVMMFDVLLKCHFCNLCKNPLFWVQIHLAIWYAKYLGGDMNWIFTSLWLPGSVTSQVENHFTEKQANILCETTPVWAHKICHSVLFVGGVGRDI